MAISSDGHAWYSMHTTTNKAQQFRLFLHFLFAKLKEQDARSLNNLVFLIDNTSIHKTPAILKFFQQHGATILFTAIYSFDHAPVELAFRYLKSIDLDRQS